MNDKPTRDDYNELIDQLGHAEVDEGPDILAVHRKKADGQSDRTVPVQRQDGDNQTQRRVTQYTPRAGSGQRRTPAGTQQASRHTAAHTASQHSSSRTAPSQRSGVQNDSETHDTAAAPRGTQKRRAPKEKKAGFGGSAWMRAIVISLILVGCAVGVALFALASANDLFGLNQEDKQVEVNVEDGMSSGDIIDLLADTGVIDQKLTFRLYAGLKSALDEFKPGQYVMNCNFSYDEIIIMLRTGIRNEEERAVVTVTFYEGMTAWEIADRLEENKVCDAEEFIEAVNTGDFSDYSFMSMIPDEELRFVRLEGFLFPDTYQFYVGEKPENAVRRFLDNFESKVTNDVIAQLNNQNLSLYEGINLASIIQGESSDTKHMGAVSSVFHNRLDTPEVYPRLESDVSRDYINNDIKPHVNIINDEQIIAYDSYQCEGLPVAPVNNPGMEAILAAAHPEDTPYFFFVNDAEGNFYFAETFDQHVTNVYKAGLIGGAHGVAVED